MVRGKLTLLLIFVAILAAAQAREAGLSLTLSTPRSTVKSGDSVPLKLIVTDISNEQVSWGAAFGAQRGPFRVQVLDQDNKVVAETPFGQQLNHIPEGGSVGTVVLSPGESMSEDLMLNKEYEIGHRGTYRVYAEGFDHHSGRTVKSNVLVLTVQ